jgi:hypothetical protein
MDDERTVGMAMTRDEILTQYEDLWRRAALEDRQQYRGSACGGTRDDGPWEWSEGSPTCAAVIPQKTWADRGPLLSAAMAHLVVGWRCPHCGYTHAAFTLATVMVHLNNAHDWTWDMFANKFRDVLTEGERLADVRG